jgi:hypothetical protein
MNRALVRTPVLWVVVEAGKEKFMMATPQFGRILEEPSL